MQPDPGKLLKAAEIENPVIGFYDTLDKSPFIPFVSPEQCIFLATVVGCRAAARFYPSRKLNQFRVKDKEIKL